jgi:hypothetical protein
MTRWTETRKPERNGCRGLILAEMASGQMNKKQKPFSATNKLTSIPAVTVAVDVEPWPRS